MKLLNVYNAAISTDDERRRFIERFAVMLTDVGMQRMAARVFACVLASDTDGLTAGELAERLDVSPAAISGAVRSLVTAGVLIRERRPGERRDHFTVGDHLWSEMFRVRGELFRRWERTMADGIAVLPADDPGARRLEESREFFSFLQQEYRDLADRWERHRSAPNL